MWTQMLSAGGLKNSEKKRVSITTVVFSLLPLHFLPFPPLTPCLGGAVRGKREMEGEEKGELRGIWHRVQDHNDGSQFKVSRLAIQCTPSLSVCLYVRPPWCACLPLFVGLFCLSLCLSIYIFTSSMIQQPHRPDNHTSSPLHHNALLNPHPMPPTRVTQTQPRLFSIQKSITDSQKQAS